MSGPTGLAPDPDTQRVVRLLERLGAAIDLRDAADPDAPAWDADREIERLVGELEPVVGRVPSRDRIPWASDRDLERLIDAVARHGRGP